jgi:hypothetical protein
MNGMRKAAASEALPGLVDTGPHRNGAVYLGVSRSIAAHVAEGRLDLERDAGRLALARTLAHQCDLAGGLGGMKREPYAVAALARELRGLLLELTGITVDDDVPIWLEEDPDLDPDAVDDTDRTGTM